MKRAISHLRGANSWAAIAVVALKGGLTLVACFSGPPRPAQVEEALRSRSVRQQKPTTEDLLRDLPPDVAALTANLLHAPAARDLLTYLWKHPPMAMTAGDLAGQVGHKEEKVASALENLERLAGATGAVGSIHRLAPRLAGARPAGGATRRPAQTDRVSDNDGISYGPSTNWTKSTRQGNYSAHCSRGVKIPSLIELGRFGQAKQGL